MPATIFSGNNVKALKSNLDLNGVTSILSVNADPASGAGVAAPLGSIAMDYLAGKVYKKTGSLDTEWQELGSGIGGINYIENSDAESGTSGWSTYADAAGSAPVDGTGGTANITWNRRVPTPPLKPLRGVADFSLVKDAVNRQGQGVSYDFTIDSADQAKILTISADYEVLSGTFATGDLAVYIIQDPAGTPVVIQPAGYQVTAATVGNKVRLAATFQTASNVTSYRLCIHVASVSASAYTLAFDSIAVSPQQVVYGAPITDWQEYTMSITATTTNPTLPTSGVVNNKALWRRVGDSVQIIYVLETGTVSGGNNGSGTYLFSLPNGLSIDTGKVPSTGTINKPLGVARLGTNRDGLIGYVPTISTNKLIVSYETSGIDLTACDNTVALMTTNNQSLMFEAQVPILGWSSSVVVSSSTDTRVVAAKYYVSSVNSPGANLPINFDTRISDTHGAVTTGSGWRFTAPVPGTYAVAIHTQQDTATNYGVRVYKNGSLHEILYYSGGGGLTASGSTLIDLVAGDYIDARPDAAGGIRGAAGPAYLSAISINRLSGPSQIAASETVAARYQVAAGVSSNSTTPVNFATRVFDSHGAVTTGASWRFSAPIAGKYSVSTVGFLASGTSNFDLYKNGSFHITLHNLNATGATSGTGLVEMISGDYIDIRTNSSVTTGSVGTAVYISIHRIGN